MSINYSSAKRYAVQSPVLHAILSIGSAALLALLLRWPFFNLPLERDEGAYGYVAWQWLQGSLPYRDAFDHKPPLIHLLYVLMWLRASPSAFVVRVWATAWFVVGVALVYLIGRQVWDRTTATVAALLYAVVGSAFNLQGSVFNTEQALIVPALAGLWLLCRWLKQGRGRDAILFGVALACVGLIKPTATPFLFALLMLGRRRPARRWLLGIGLALLSALGALLPWVLYFVAQGAWPDLVWALVTYNRRYLAESQTRWNVSELVDLLAPLTAFVLVALGGIALAICPSTADAFDVGPHGRAPVQPSKAATPQVGRERMVVVGWVVAFAVAAVASLRPYVHYYYPLLPGLALLAAPTLLWLMRQPYGARASERLAHWLTPLLLLLLLLTPSVVNNLQAAPLSPAAQSERLYGRDGTLFAEAEMVARYIQARSNPTEPIWVWGSEPQIYLLAQRSAATRYSYDFPLFLFPQAADEVQAQLRRIPPSMVVVYRGSRPPDFDEVVTRRGLVLLAQIGGFEVFGQRGF